MNKQVIQEYISLYKSNFDQVNQLELYKWRAVKCFQDNWDIDAPEFDKMLIRSLRLTKNLLDSGQYFPHRMIIQYASHKPNEVRDHFKSLYDEEIDLLTRIQGFSNAMNIIHKEIFSDRISYQDVRAVIVYLTLKFPERYFFYKFEMFKSFSKIILYPYTPVKGHFENIGHYNSMCQIIRYELSNDQELLQLHMERLKSDCYIDDGLNILTQDFIYAVTKHLSMLVEAKAYPPVAQSLLYESVEDLNTKPQSVSLRGVQINYTQTNIENKRIGDLGELWVLGYEAEKLRLKNLQHKINEIDHAAKNIGDGIGYDIVSLDENGNKIFIEVKTTRGPLDTPFFITSNELEKSKRDPENYLLYRVYNFDWSRNTADLLVVKGDLTKLCDCPTSFKILLDINK